MIDSRLLQLADSAFPAGSFAHSHGFEALTQLGLLRPETLKARLGELAWNTATAALPFLNDAHGGATSGDWALADEACHVFLSSDVANRASRSQGRAFLLAVEALTAAPKLAPARWAHVAPAMGAALARLGVGRDDARQLFLFGAVRAALSAAVRLGVVGPLAAQAVLFGLHGTLGEVLAATASWRSDDAALVSPVVELAQAAQDRLYSRLFQS